MYDARPTSEGPRASGGRFKIQSCGDGAGFQVHRGLFDIPDRGYLRPGYAADFVLVDPNSPWTVSESGILSKCGWSPFTGDRFSARMAGTWVNGVQVWDGERVIEPADGVSHAGRRLEFAR